MVRIRLGKGVNFLTCSKVDDFFYSCTDLLKRSIQFSQIQESITIPIRGVSKIFVIRDGFHFSAESLKCLLPLGQSRQERGGGWRGAEYHIIINNLLWHLPPIGVIHKGQKHTILNFIYSSMSVLIVNGQWNTECCYAM